MSSIKKHNNETNQWEKYGSDNALDIKLLDLENNFENKNVEGALRELSNKEELSSSKIKAHNTTISEHSKKILEHSETIEWLKENGGGGGGGTTAPSISSTFENNTIVDKDTDVYIPLYFKSPTLGNGTAIIVMDGIEVNSIAGIKQGNNRINIGKLSNLNTEVSIYVKDRANQLSNQLTWNIICGGLELTINFDSNADYQITDTIAMQYTVASVGTDPIMVHLVVDYDTYEFECNNGFNEYIFKGLGIGVHNVSMHVTSGKYATKPQIFNIIVVNSNSLFVSSVFNGGEFEFGTPIAIDYRISKIGSEEFVVKLFLNNNLEKTLKATVGNYYWTLNNVEVGTHTAKIRVESQFNEVIELEKSFTIKEGEYIPLKINEAGLSYRLNAYGRTNNDLDKESPIDNSGNGIKSTMHNFNYYTNGWIDNNLVIDGGAYVEIDCYPWSDNAIYGSTIELQYRANDIGFDDAVVIDYTDIETPYKGFYVDINESIMKSLANTGKVYLDGETWITLTFAIDRKNKFGKIYINGICSRAFSLSDSGSGTSAKYEDFTHNQKIFLGSKKGLEKFGACEIKDLRIYNRTLSDKEVLDNFIAQTKDLLQQKTLYDFNYNNKTMPSMKLYGDMSNMTLDNPVKMRVKYTSPNEEKYGQSFDLPHCMVQWQGTSSLQYVLKNFTITLKDENMADYYYTPYVNGILENIYCTKCDYMESTHSRNTGMAKFVNDCLYDTKNPAQLKNANYRNAINGFPVIFYINDEIQGSYNFNLDRHSTLSFGYESIPNTLCYEISANSDSSAGAFYSWNQSSGKTEIDYYKSDFEAVYPPTRIVNDDCAELIRLINFVDKSSDEDFRDNLSKYFNKEYLFRYFLTVQIIGAVDSLGKNAKLVTFGDNIWYFQFYDLDTIIGLDNTGFLKFDSDIELQDQNVFNTTGSRLWQRVQLLFQAELQEQYALMRKDRFTVNNFMKYIYEEQISKIPQHIYNIDMQKKYLDFGSSYLYALHGSGELQIKKWIRNRILYCDTLFGYNITTSDYITVRANKMGEVHLDIQTYIPMYLRVKFRDEANDTGTIIKRVGKGETVHFSYNLPTETDQEILIYGGHYLKSLGDLSNLRPTTMLIANANRLTEIEVHSDKLINTDLSECRMLQKIDISDCPALGTGIGAQPILNIQNLKYLKYLNAYNTKLTAIYTLQAGGNLEEIYYPSSIQVIQLTNLTYLHTVGIPYDGEDITTPKNLANVSISNCKNINKLIYPHDELETNPFKSLKYVQNLSINNSLDFITEMNFDSFSKLITVKISSLNNLMKINFNNLMLNTDISTLKSITLDNLPNINKFTLNVSDNQHKIEFIENNSIINLGGLKTLTSIESNYSIKGLNKIILPLSCQILSFDNTYGDGINEIKNIWSSDAIHTTDGFNGIDFKNMTIKAIDMMGLSKIEKGVNFNIAPTVVNPNLNTSRDGSLEKPWFRPSGVINLNNYTGEMTGMFKGLDLDKVNILLENPNLTHTDISSLFEGCTFKNFTKVNSIIAKFTEARNLNYILKDTEINNAENIIFPNRKFTLKGGFMNSKLMTDIDIPLNASDVTNCFKNCKNMTNVRSNWMKNFSNILSDGCYSGCSEISVIDGIPGTIENIPVNWGGYGFEVGNIGKYLIQTPSDNYMVVFGDILQEGTVDWGDGEASSQTNSHVFKKAGAYTVKGKILVNRNEQSPHSSISETLKTVSLIPSSITSYKNMFNNCYNLINIDLSESNTSKVVDVSHMCENCIGLTSSATMNLNNVTELTNMYFGCSNLIYVTFDNLKNDTSNVTNILGGCKKITTLGFERKINKNSARRIIDIINNMIKEEENGAMVTDLEARLKCLETLILDSTTLKL